MRDPFQGIKAAGQAVSYLSAALATGEVTHAYLITGPAGSGLEELALRFGAAYIAAGDEAEFGIAIRGSHPDLHILRPASAVGYLAEQVREVVHDATLAPVRSSGKVYIVEQADRLKGTSANAFLKTLEEPPSDVLIIMLASSEQAVLQTLRSRCQVLTCAGTGARAFVSTEVDEIVLYAAQGAGNRALLGYAKRLLDIAYKGIEQLKDAHAAEEEASADYLAAGARKALAERHKREVSMEQRQAVLAVVAQIRSWLRDCLLVSQGAPELAAGSTAAMREVANNAGTPRIIKALKAADDASMRISYNVTPQLALEALLLEVREAVCPQ